MFDNEEQRNAAYHELFTSATGASILADLREDFYDVLCYVPGVEMSVNDTVFHEGQRSVVEMILGRLRDHLSEDEPRTAARKRDNGGTYL